MKILRISPDIYPYTVGGYGIHCHEMSNLQVEKGHQVTVLTCPSEKTVKEEIKVNYDTLFFKRGVEIFGNPITFSMMNRLSDIINDFDVIHAHSHLFFPTVITSVLSKIKKEKIPLVITNHGLVSQSMPLPIQFVYLKTVAKWIFSWSNAVLCYSTKMKEEMSNWNIPVENVHIIHNGVNTRQFKPDAYIKKEFDIIWVGRYVFGKNIDCLLDSFSLIKKEKKDFTAVLIGDGPLKKEMIKKSIGLGLENNITFINELSNKDIVKFYQKSKVFALSSLDEGVPRTILEAMACGLPVVTTRLPQLVEIINGCGQIVDQNDAEGLSQSLLNLFNKNTIREKYSERSIKKINELYSWNDTVDRTLSVYQRLLNK